MSTEAGEAVDPGTFQYTIRNEFQRPYFCYSATLPLANPAVQPFLYYMQIAVDNNENFEKFTATYFKKFGYEITSINGVAANPNSKTFWVFLVADNKPIDVGVSNYYPRANDHITMNFTNKYPKA